MNLFDCFRRTLPSSDNTRITELRLVCSGADSGLDGGRTWDSESLRHPRAQAQIEMTPRDTANSTVRAAGGDANDLGGMHTRSKRQRSTASESVLDQVCFMFAVLIQCHV